MFKEILLRCYQRCFVFLSLLTGVFGGWTAVALFVVFYGLLTDLVCPPLYLTPSSPFFSPLCDPPFFSLFWCGSITTTKRKKELTGLRPPLIHLSLPAHQCTTAYMAACGFGLAQYRTPLSSSSSDTGEESVRGLRPSRLLCVHGTTPPPSRPFHCLSFFFFSPFKKKRTLHIPLSVPSPSYQPQHQQHYRLPNHQNKKKT